MKFIITFAISLFMFTLIFTGFAAAVVAAISFISWSVPTLEHLRDAGPLAVRIIVTISTICSLFYMFSRDGRREWQL